MATPLNLNPDFWIQGTNPDPYISFKTLNRVIQQIILYSRVTAGLRSDVVASTQIERAVAYGLPIPKWISKRFPVEPRKAWLMDYSVGGPLWAEWQRLQTHSEWDRWKGAYEQKQPLIFFQTYFDWLLENNCPIEAGCIKTEVIDNQNWNLYPNTRYYAPPFEEEGKLVWLKERPNSEPVEGAA